YSGIGYRYWLRGLGSREDIMPMSEEYSWYYVPVGIRIAWKVSRKIELSLDNTLKLMFKGNIKVNLSEGDPYYNDPSASLGSRTGWRIMPGVNFEVYPKLHLLIGPWYEYSAIQQSPVFAITYAGKLWGYGYEPSSRTHQFGLDIYLGRRF
ncbi:MAG: hypothetical protein PHF84_03195, partial [bacterium]|nr:hypothetical protein [bacterium]